MPPSLSRAPARAGRRILSQRLLGEILSVIRVLVFPLAGPLSSYQLRSTCYFVKGASRESPRIEYIRRHALGRSFAIRRACCTLNYPARRAVRLGNIPTGLTDVAAAAK